MKKLSGLIGVLLFIGVGAYSQGITKPLTSNIPDTITGTLNYKGLRFTGPTVLYAVNTTTINSSALFTCIGGDWEDDYYDSAVGKFYTNIAVGIQFGAGGQIAPRSVSAVTCAAITVSTQRIGKFELPFKLTVGVLYNFMTKSAMFATGPGIPLNN